MHELEEVLGTLAHSVYRLEKTMSALTDQVDQALAVLSQDSTSFGAALEASKAAQAVIQGQLDAANRGEAADATELQKALDALNASHQALTAQGTPASPASVPSPAVAPTADATAAPAPAAPVAAPVAAADPTAQPVVPPVA
jgi:peptidoglycan hydrolase CwlO-like protein